jgi:hypothetical protein
LLVAPAKSPLSVGSDRFFGRPPGARGSSQFPVVRSRAFSFTATANRMSSFPSLYFMAYNTFATISAAFAAIGAIACRRSNSNEMYVPAPGPAPMSRLGAGSFRLQIGHGSRGDPDAIDVRSMPNGRGIEGERLLSERSLSRGSTLLTCCISAKGPATSKRFPSRPAGSARRGFPASADYRPRFLSVFRRSRADEAALTERVRSLFRFD